MSNSYVQMQQRHQEDYNGLPIGWAFGKKQFAEMMTDWGLTPNDTDKIVSIGCGGFLRKSDLNALNDVIARHKQEREEAIKADKRGNGFIYQMFLKELNNHEYGWTGELQDTLDALEFTMSQIREHSNLKHGLALALANFN